MLSRRAFLIAGGAAGGGLFLAYALWPTPTNPLRGGPDESVLGAWLKISRDGRIIVVCSQSEMGQGVYTSLPMLVAEELDADWQDLVVEPAPASRVYVNRALVESTIEDNQSLPAVLRSLGLLFAGGIADLAGVQMTGGSSSIRNAWLPLRQTGAAARDMLIRVAARRWKVDPKSCRTEAGEVIHDASGRRENYGRLASAAVLLSPPSKPRLKAPGEFHTIGQPVPRLDIPAKTDGEAKFGIDIRLPGMSYAAVRMAPPTGGRLVQVRPKDVENDPGIQAVVTSPDTVAVVARGWYQAEKALEKLAPRFEAPPAGRIGDDDVHTALSDALDSDDVIVHSKKGDAAGTIKAATTAGNVIERTYEVPYLAHACMEPLNCTVLARGNRCDVWIPTQVPGLVKSAVAGELHIPEENVNVTTTLLGGGFGRRLEVDIARQAAAISREVSRPIQLIWSREEDTRHDVYRPAAMARLSAAVGSGGHPTAFAARVASQSIMQGYGPRNMPDAPVFDGDPTTVEGLADTAYGFDELLIEQAPVDLPLPVGFWRSVGHSANAFFIESFVDELAANAKIDGLQMRRELLAGAPRHLAVLEQVVQASGYPRGMGDGGVCGLAIHRSFGSIVGEVAELERTDRGFRLARVTCVIDCGVVVNPDTVRAQMEGGIIFGLTAARFGTVTLADGEIREGNFDSYRMLLLADAPDIDVRIVTSGERIGGVGEPAVPPIAPALANALARATGQRVYRLPFDARETALI